MKTRTRFVNIFLFIGLAAFCGSGFLAPFVGAATKASSEESSNTTQVRHKLERLPWYGVFDNLEFQVNGSQVILSGQLTSEHATTKKDAEDAVKKINGVTSVVNNIEVLPPSPMDDQIRRAEYRAIFSRPTLGRYAMGPIPEIHIIVNRGNVTLDGAVSSPADRTVAEMAANSVPGVFSVTDDLVLGT